MRRLSAFTSVLACLIAFAPAASAIYILTPLMLTSDGQVHAVGDEIVLTIAPQNESARTTFAGRTLRIAYHYDAYDENEQAGGGDIGNVTLDEAATGSFHWTIPADVDNKNVFVNLVDGDENVAFANVPVGDAPPILFAASGVGDKGMIDSEPPAETASDDAPRNVPVGGVALVGIALAAAVAIAMRRK